MFRPILGKDLKLSAEELEIGLLKPDAALAQLHIQLLNVTLFSVGIPIFISSFLVYFYFLFSL